MVSTGHGFELLLQFKYLFPFACLSTGWYKAMKEGVKMHDVHIEPKSYKLELLKKLNVQQIEYMSKA